MKYRNSHKNTLLTISCVLVLSFITSTLQATTSQSITFQCPTPQFYLKQLNNFFLNNYPTIQGNVSAENLPSITFTGGMNSMYSQAAVPIQYQTIFSTLDWRGDLSCSYTQGELPVAFLSAPIPSGYTATPDGKGNFTLTPVTSSSPTANGRDLKKEGTSEKAHVSVPPQSKTAVRSQGLQRR
jgi:hypothetical protein